MDESQKELQNIFQGQSAMKEILTELHRKMDDIISRQERAFNAITTIQVIFRVILIIATFIKTFELCLNFDTHNCTLYTCTGRWDSRATTTSRISTAGNRRFN